MSPTTTPLYLIFKWINIFIALLLTVIIIALAAKLSHFYYTEVRPYRADIESVLANADTEHRNLSIPMQTMIDADFYCSESPEPRPIFNFNSNCGMTKEGQVARLVQAHFLAAHNPRRTMANNTHHILLSYFIVRPLSQNEQNTLISELTFFTPEATSFNQFSMFYFYKPLSQLTLEETATLVAFTKAPSQYLRDNERLQQRQQVLLERYDFLVGKVEY